MSAQRVRVDRFCFVPGCKTGYSSDKKARRLASEIYPSLFKAPNIFLALMAKSSNNRRTSVYNSMNEKTERRRSFFEKSEYNMEEKEETNALLDKWNQRWGGHNLDYVNVLKYPEAYVQKNRDEREMWIHCIENTIQNMSRNSNYAFVVNEDILTTEQKATLRDIDSKINEYIEKSTDFLRNFQVHKRMQEIRLEHIERKRKMVEKLVIAKK